MLFLTVIIIPKCRRRVARLAGEVLGPQTEVCAVRIKVDKGGAPVDVDKEDDDVVLNLRRNCRDVVVDGW
jgi:hypothetical protein